MSKLKPETIDKIEKLAMLKLSQEEKTQISGDLEKIVDMFDKLDELDTEDVEPLVYMNPEPQTLAPDVVGKAISKSDALENSKNTEKGFFTVPKIIK